MTLNELQRIHNEIKLRNSISQNMINHCFICNPTKEDIQLLIKMGLTYQQCNDSSAYIFARFRRTDNETISFLNLKVDIQCDENGFMSYTIFSANGNIGIKEKTDYPDLKENDIIGIIQNQHFGYIQYEPYNFYWSILIPKTDIDLSTYQNILISLA